MENFGTLNWVVMVAITIVSLIAWWRIFQKAGQPGWAILIPIYSAIVELKVVNKPVWWILLLLIPIVNIVILIIVALEIGKAFGKSTAFSVILLILIPIGYLIIGFDNSQYQLASTQTPMQPTSAQPTA